MNPAPRRILAISGSLRAKSINTAVLQAMQSIAPATLMVTVYPGLGELPHFNPDLDTDSPPTAILMWREAVRAADALLFCTPEYAHGVPGTLKNALDWLVSYEPFLLKPVAIINARPGATFAHASLRETLGVMNARLLDAASVTLPLATNALDAATLLALPVIRIQLEVAVAALAAAPR
jgi:chromate reductase